MNSLEASLRRLTRPMASTLRGSRRSLARSAAMPLTPAGGSTVSAVVSVSPVSTLRPLARRARLPRGVAIRRRRPLRRRVPPPGERPRQERQDDRAQDGEAERHPQHALEDEEEEPEADEGDDGDDDDFHKFRRRKAESRRQSG